MADATSPTTKFPKHHFTLSDGSTTLGFICGRIDGDDFVRDDTAIRRFPLERHAVKTYEGQSKYDDSQWPYITIAQDDWSGGRGSETFDDDTSRFYDSYRADTSTEGRVILGGQETYCDGFRTIETNMPGDIQWITLSGSTQYVAATFDPTTTLDADYAEIWIRCVGSPDDNGNLIVEICSDSGGDPGAALKTTAAIEVGDSDVVSKLVVATWGGTQTLSNGTDYWIKIYHSAPDASNYYQVAGTGAAGGKISSDGSSWSAGTNELRYQIKDADAFSAGKFFEYKSALYFYSQPDTGNSLLYLNGDRGAADDNSGDKSTLVDGSKSWTADEWINSIVLVTKGPGSDEIQPWRLITDNDGTTLTVTPNWNTTHTTSTEYVILGSTSWTQVEDLGAYVTDHAVADEFVYFARDDLEGGNNVLRYQAYNNAGTWTDRNDAEGKVAKYLQFINHPDTGPTLYGACNQNAYYGTYVWQGQIPDAWGDLYYSLGTLSATNTPWDEQVIANVTVGTEFRDTKITVAEAFGTGIAATELIDATDITQGKYLGVMIKSDVTISAGDIKLGWDSAANLGGAPNYVDFPALTADQWTWALMSISPFDDGTTDEKALVSVGINVVTDNGAQNIWMRGGIKIIADNLDVIDLPNDARINRLIAYSGNAADPRENPWVITENSVHEIQAQNSNLAVPLPIGEIKNLSSSINGQAACVNDVYLWFNLKNKIERYYSRNLDDVGPDRDAGLPSDRSGEPTFLLSAPGRVFLGIEGQAGEYGSVLVYRNNGWHEVYRNTQTGQGLTSAYIQTIPNQTVDYLFIQQESDIIRIPISYNPYLDTDYAYTHEGHIESGWVYGSNVVLTKFWHKLKAYTENSTTNSYWIAADYKLDDDTSWTAISGGFDSPFDSLTISSATPPTTTGRRFKYRLRFYTIDNDNTPLLKASIIEAYGVDEVKYGYSFPCLLSEDNQDVNLMEEFENALGQSTRAETGLAILQGWIDAGTPLTQKSPYSILDAKTVIVDPVASQPIYLNPEAQIEKHVLHITTNEI